ncbi:hypothetical protein Dimus_035244 [Dionaea muscipula]
MPLVRFEVKNEYGLGVAQLYNGANAEDPRAILNGVAVAGLVGLLRQLGDLADFAAEVFHGLQEQVASATCRSRKLMARVQNLEAALTPLEKDILSQTSHIHFAYTPGSKWHARIKNEQNHFICSGFPQFILDSYEDSRELPRLQWLDKFDTGGPGSCLKRYSDPSFFRRVSVSANTLNNEKTQKERKARKTKKQSSKKTNRQFSHIASFLDAGRRVQLASPTGQGPSSPAQTVSTFDAKFKSDPGDLSESLGSRDRMNDFIESVFQPSTSEHLDEVMIMESCSGLNEQVMRTHLKSVYSDEQAASVLDNIPCCASVRPEDEKIMESYSEYDEQITTPLHAVYFEQQAPLVVDDTPCCVELEKTSPRSPSVTWDEKTEIVEATGLYSGIDQVQEVPGTIFEPRDFAFVRLQEKGVNQVDTSVEAEESFNMISDANELDETESETENYVDALNTIESESENEFDYHMKREVELYSNTTDGVIEPSISATKGEVVEQHPAEHQTSFITYNHGGNGVASNLDDSNSSSIVAHESFQCAESSCNLLEEEQSQSPDDSVSPVCSTGEKSRVNMDTSSVPNTLAVHYSVHSNAADVLEKKSSVCESESYGSGGTSTLACVDEPTTVADSGVQEFLVQSSDVGSAVIFWTNGNLLGLEPSKPPDFGVPNGLSRGSINTSIENAVALSNHNQDGFSISCQFSDSGINTGPGEFGYARPANQFHNSTDQNLSNSTSVLPQSEEPAAADTKTAITGGSHGCEDRLPFLSRLGRDFLLNGLCRSGSPSYDGNPKPEVLVITSESENGQCRRVHDHFVEPILNEQLASPVNSPPPSPPLEHMKISFQPIKDLETCRLKLRYPDGIDDDEGPIDAFPSFQLVPELITLRHDVGSDSDDDTFCRSYSYLSHDRLSYLSESDSEVWDSGGTIESSENMLNHGSHRTSPIESILGSSDLDAMAGKSIDENGTRETLARMGGVRYNTSSLHLPVLNTMSQFPYEEAIAYKSNESIEGLLPQDPSQPPPLRLPISRKESYGAIHGNMVESDGPIELCDPQLVENADSPQDKHASANFFGRIEEKTTMAMEIKRLAEQKMNGQKGCRQPINGRREDDDKDDFLNEIRAKSFNLRRTETSRPNVTTAATTNEAVTAILEKANAIRQAVGSDDGEEEDDTWSES